MIGSAMKTPISPKVTASTLAGVVASLLLAVVTLITPDLFEGLGKWSNLAYGLTIALVMAVAGYLKGDPLRVTAGDTTDEAAVEAAKQTSLAATAVNVPAPAVSFASTQAKIDGLPDVPAPVAPADPNPTA